MSTVEAGQEFKFSGILFMSEGRLADVGCAKDRAECEGRFTLTCDYKLWVKTKSLRLST